MTAVRRQPLVAQVLALNAVLVFATVLVASLAARLRLDVSVQRREFLVYILAVCGSLLVNALLLRRRFAPLERLIDAMEGVDLASANGTLGSAGGPVATLRGRSREESRLIAAFNRMLDRLAAERRQAAREILRAQENERRRLAQDLHDEVNQALTAVVLRLEASIQAAPVALRHELEETKRLGIQAMEELLRLARELRPTALDDHGLLPALETQVGRFGERTGIATIFHCHGIAPPLSDEQQLVIYRVVQESLSNAAQHAGARNIEVELSFVGRTVLQIRDDGRGFSGGRDGGLGVSGMRERAMLVGGRLAVRSKPGKGTTIELGL
jgi:two-component system, NarL family, sensor histidine kinase UhpB